MKLLLTGVMPLPKDIYEQEGFKHIKPEHRTVIRLNATASLAVTFEKDVDGNWWLANHLSDPTGEKDHGIPIVKGRQRVKITSRILIEWLNRHHPWDEQGAIMTEGERFPDVELTGEHKEELLRAFQSLIK